MGNHTPRPPHPSPCRDRISLFWVHSLRPPYSSLSRNILSEVFPFLCSPPVLVRVTREHIHRYSFERGVWRPPTQLSQSVVPGSVYTVIDDTTIACCGGTSGLQSFSTPHPDNAYIIRLAEDLNYVRELPPMQCKRSHPGVAHYCGHIYTFGGKAYPGFENSNRTRQGGSPGSRSTTSLGKQ